MESSKVVRLRRRRARLRTGGLNPFKYQVPDIIIRLQQSLWQLEYAGIKFEVGWSIPFEGAEVCVGVIRPRLFMTLF
jgi:hypothetical protein